MLIAVAVNFGGDLLLASRASHLPHASVGHQDDARDRTMPGSVAARHRTFAPRFRVIAARKAYSILSIDELASVAAIFAALYT